MDYDFVGTNYDGNFRVNFSPTNYCNYDCSYCASKLNRTDTKVHNPPPEPYYKALGDLFDQMDAKIYLSVCGHGEPTLSPLTPRIVEHFCPHPKISDVNVITNFSAPMSVYEELYRVSNEKFHISASFHPEYAKVDDFVERGLRCSEMGKFRSTIVIPPENFDEMVAVYNTLRDAYPIECQVIPIPKIIVGIPFTDYFTAEQIQWFLDLKLHPKWSDKHRFYVDGVELNYYEVVFNGLNKFKGWKCIDGKKGYVVDKLGNVAWMEENRKFIGNLFMKTFKLPESHDVICNKDLCTCPSLQDRPKQRIE